MVAAALLTASLLGACAASERSAPPAGSGPGGNQAAAVVTLGPEATEPALVITAARSRPTATLPASATPRPSPTASAEPTGEATAGATGSPTPPAEVTDEEYAVLSAILRSGLAPRQRRLLIQDTTVAPPLGAGQVADLEASGGPELLADYRARNALPAALGDKIKLPLPVARVTRGELDRLANDPGWLAFNRRYPRANGYVTVSRVGFDPTGELAMVSVVHHMAAGVERATMFVLESSEGRWEILDAYTLSVS